MVIVFDHLVNATFAAKIPMQGCQVGHLSDHNSKGGWPTPMISWSIITLVRCTNPYSFYPRSSSRLGVIFHNVPNFHYFFPISARPKNSKWPLASFLFREGPTYSLVQSLGQGRVVIRWPLQRPRPSPLVYRQNFFSTDCSHSMSSSV